MRLASPVRVLAASLLLTACGGAAPKSATESTTAPAAALAPPSEPPQAGASAPEGQGTKEGGGPGDSVGTSKEKFEGPGARSASMGAPAAPPPPGKASRRQHAGPAEPSRSPSDEDEARPLAAVAEASGERISRDALAGVVDANLERFRPCATGDAKVELRLTLSGGGSVTQAEARSSQPDDARLRDCVVDVLRGLSFPRRAGSDTSTVSFQLVLSKPAF